jgi:hypothetical protein
MAIRYFLGLPAGSDGRRAKPNVVLTSFAERTFLEISVVVLGTPLGN